MTGLGFGEASPLAFPAYPRAPSAAAAPQPPPFLLPHGGGSVRHSILFYFLRQGGRTRLEYFSLERGQDVLIWHF